MTQALPPSALPRPGFEMEVVTVRLDQLLPTRSIPERIKATAKYQSIVASLKVVGLIEPLNVFPQKGGQYLLLDGHVRLLALKELGHSEVLCTVAVSEEAYTYNKNVNLIPRIQATKMILKALSAGVSEARIAQALNLSVNTIHHSKTLLSGVCEEAVELLRDKEISSASIGLLKRVKPLRQMEIAEIMVASGNYSVSYARGLVLTTAKDQLVDPEGKKIPGARPDDLARLEHEMRVQQKDFRMIDATYNEQVMDLTIARGYLRALLGNARVVRFLSNHQRELLTEFQRIADATTLEA